MKKMATPPQSASNHRFHSYGWSRALNYVAKCYLTEDGMPDTSREGSDAVLTDIMLQYEANHWANEFNKSDPPRKIDFIRAYAMEFVDRPGKPMFAVERFIAGSDSYGNGFLKHNTNSGFVDLDTHRKTPQVFSAHSFYASHGERLVADIQGVGDLYTDPQVCCFILLIITSIYTNLTRDVILDRFSPLTIDLVMETSVQEGWLCFSKHFGIVTCPI